MMGLDTPETCTGWRNILRISCTSSWLLFSRLHANVVLSWTEYHSNIQTRKFLFRGFLFYQILTLPYRLQHASIANILLILSLLLAKEHSKRMIIVSPVYDMINLCQLQLDCHTVAVVQCTFTHKQYNKVKVKVMQFHYRPGESLRIPGGWGSKILRQSAHEGGKVVSPTHRPPLPQETFLVLISVRGWVNPRAIVRPEELCQWKNPVTPSRIEPATFRLVAQCLNQLRHRVPPKQYNRTT